MRPEDDGDDFFDDLRLAAECSPRAPPSSRRPRFPGVAVATIFSWMTPSCSVRLPGASDQDRLVGIDRRSRRTSVRARRPPIWLYQGASGGTGRGARGASGPGARSTRPSASTAGGHAVYGKHRQRQFLLRSWCPARARPLLSSLGGRAGGGEAGRRGRDTFWTTYLGADPAAPGRSVTVNGHPYTLIGVAPPEFRGTFTPLKVDAWVPLAMQAQLRPRRESDRCRLAVDVRAVQAGRGPRGARAGAVGAVRGARATAPESPASSGTRPPV